MGRTTKKYNPEIDFWRLFFAICVFAFHTHKFVPDGEYSLLPRGYIATGFFFMVSGYFMAARIRSDALSGIRRSTASFLLGKVRSFYKPMVVSVVLAFLILQIKDRSAPLVFYRDGLHAILELLLVCAYGMKGVRQNNGPLWYLSAMLIAMALIYPIAKKYRNYFFKVGAPILSLLSFSLIGSLYGSIATTLDFAYLVTTGILRGIGGVCAGVFLNECCTLWQQKDLRLTAFGKITAAFLELFCLGTLMYLANAFPQIEPTSGYCYLAVFVLFAFLLIVFSGATGLQEKTCNWNFHALSQISLYLYFNHRVALTIMILYYPEFSYWKKTLWATVITVGVMILCRLIVFVWETVQKRYGKKIGSWFFKKKEEPDEPEKQPESEKVTV